MVDRFARTAPDGVKVLVVTDYTPGDLPYIDGLVGRLSVDDVPRCRHLRRGLGRGFVYACEGAGRCLDCHMSYEAAERARGRSAGGAGAFCQCCRVPVEPALLRPVVVEVGAWSILSALSPACAVVLLDRGGRSAPSSGGVR
ncbi:hypothetical protein ABZ299_12425 [Streptomyces sp. NPDC006184]|uniref:hypothetical protein n=1 Tax=Streptomyces sp. NPDC006184 TaxID=3155455 RepID=UPI0033A46C84